MTRRHVFLALMLVAGAVPHAHAVIEGFVDPNTAASPWAGVGSITANGGTYSGVAIGPRFVLTAAHVVAGVRPGALAFNVNRGGDVVARVAVAEVHVHPAYRGLTPSRDALVHDDIAVLRLSGPIPFGTPTYPLARRAPWPGERLVFVGYGAGGTGASGPSVPPHPAVKRVGSNVVERLYQDPARAGRIELYRFAFNPLPGGSPLESMLAGGDSGSPAFIRADDGWHVAGINTFVYDAPAGRGGGGIAVSPYRQWILSIVGTQ